MPLAANLVESKINPMKLLRGLKIGNNSLIAWQIKNMIIKYYASGDFVAASF